MSSAGTREPGCVRCGLGAGTHGLLCETCVGSLQTLDGLLPEHIVGSMSGGDDAYLADRWGRAFPLRRRTTVGRDGADLSILDASISRYHAELRLQDGHWRVIDLGSRNGTFVGDAPATATDALEHGQRISFANVAFFFLPGPPPADRREAVAFVTVPRDTSAAPGLSLELHEPRRGGGGVLEIDGQILPLTLLQYRLLDVLYERARKDEHLSHHVRGYVPSAELIIELPWSTPHPNEDNLKQLVRRMRTVLSATPLNVQGAHGLGYRLVWPR